MLRKDKNGNETGLTGLKRNVQKEPPKKFYLRGELINQSIKSSNKNRTQKTQLIILKIIFPKNCKIFLSRTFSCVIVWWALHDCFLSTMPGVNKYDNGFKLAPEGRVPNN